MNTVLLKNQEPPKGIFHIPAFQVPFKHIINFQTLSHLHCFNVPHYHIQHITLSQICLLTSESLKPSLQISKVSFDTWVKALTDDK